MRFSPRPAADAAGWTRSFSCGVGATKDAALFTATGGKWLARRSDDETRRGRRRGTAPDDLRTGTRGGRDAVTNSGRFALHWQWGSECNTPGGSRG